MPQATFPSPSVDAVVSVMRKRGYTVFTDRTGRGYDLNIVGIRSAAVVGDAFDDWIIAFHRAGGGWASLALPATTDPGTYYRERPLNVRGTAVLVPGQYRGALKLGRHRNSYAALVQATELPVWRDADRDERLDTEGQPIDRGWHGINLHRASRSRASTRVGQWSAGCQVVQDPVHFDALMGLCRAAAQTYGPRFTYTLLTAQDFG